MLSPVWGPEMPGPRARQGDEHRRGRGYRSVMGQTVASGFPHVWADGKPFSEPLSPRRSDDSLGSLVGPLPAASRQPRQTAVSPGVSAVGGQCPCCQGRPGRLVHRGGPWQGLPRQPVTCCLWDLGQGPQLSELWFPHLQNGNGKKRPSLGGGWETSKMTRCRVSTRSSSWHAGRGWPHGHWLMSGVTPH